MPGTHGKHACLRKRRADAGSATLLTVEAPEKFPAGGTTMGNALRS